MSKYKLISDKWENEINNLLLRYDSVDFINNYDSVVKIFNGVTNDIPEKKRISTGRYSVVKELGVCFYYQLCSYDRDVVAFGNNFFEYTQGDSFIRSLGVQIICLNALANGPNENFLLFMENAATDEDWILRECSSGFIRRVVKEFPSEMHKWYLEMVKSDNPFKRRFACESLRPVVENSWFKKKPEYPFSIIENLYEEPCEYPRSSIGNSLSDWLRIDENFTLPIVKKLAMSKNKNSRWIAFRSLRNIVKVKPIEVMDILGVDEYVYKDRKFYRNNLNIK